MKMILDLFAGSLTVTVYKDSHITTATATPDSSLAKNDEVALDCLFYTTHSSVLAWRVPGTGEPGGLPSMGSHRVGHN